MPRPAMPNAGTATSHVMSGFSARSIPASPTSTTANPAWTKRWVGHRPAPRAWIHAPPVQEIVAAVSAIPASVAETPRQPTRVSATNASTPKNAQVRMPRRSTAAGSTGRATSVPGKGGRAAARPFHREVGARPRAEGIVVALLLGSAIASVAFVVVLFSGANTQLLGISLALALGLFGAALAVAANALVPREQAVEARPGLAQPEAQPPVEERLAGAREGVSRRRLLGAAGVAAGTALGAAVAAPITSLGPAVGNSIVDTPWRRGRGLVGGGGQ